MQTFLRKQGLSMYNYCLVALLYYRTALKLRKKMNVREVRLFITSRGLRYYTMTPGRNANTYVNNLLIIFGNYEDIKKKVKISYHFVFLCIEHYILLI